MNDVHAKAMRRQRTVRDDKGRDHSLYLLVIDGDVVRVACTCGETFRAPKTGEVFAAFDTHIALLTEEVESSG